MLIAEANICLLWVVMCVHTHMWPALLAAGHVYHLEFDSPPSNVPGLTERLIQIHGDANDAEQVSQRLAAHEAEGSVLQDWLRHFSRLMRPLDGAADLKDVLTAASDIVNGILRAKAAATSANTALAAAKQAKQSADKVCVCNSCKQTAGTTPCRWQWQNHAMDEEFSSSINSFCM